MSTNAISESTVNFASYYDNGAKAFPVLTMDATSSSTKQGKNAVAVSHDIERTYRVRPFVPETTSFTNPGNAVDTSLSTKCTHTLNATNNSSASGQTETTETIDIDYTLPNISGKITLAKLYVKASITGSVNSDGGEFKLLDVSAGTSTIITSGAVSGGATWSTSSAEAIDGTGTAHTVVNWTPNLVDGNGDPTGKLPSSIKLRMSCEANSQQDGTSGTNSNALELFDIWVFITVKEDYANEPSSAGKAVEALEKIYLGTDGLPRSWSSGLALHPHEIHRDILYRYLGITATPDNWSGSSGIDTQKSGDCRFFTKLDDQKPVFKYLQELAYEGGFVFRFRSDGSPVYHFIENSPSNDIYLSHSNISGLTFSHDDLTSLITDWVVQYLSLIHI